MSIQQAIKELEGKAKESDYWKNKYFDLRMKLKDILSILQEHVSIPRIAKTYNKGNQDIFKVVETLYDDAKNKEIEINTTYVISVLEKNNIRSHSDIVTKVKKLLIEKPGIQVRRQGIQKYYFYVEAMDTVKFNNPINQ